VNSKVKSAVFYSANKKKNEPVIHITEQELLQQTKHLNNREKSGVSCNLWSQKLTPFIINRE